MNFLILAATVMLSWDPVPGADHYDVCMHTKSMASGTAPYKVYRTTEPKYVVPSLTVGTKYYFYIRTFCPFNTLLGNSNELIYTAQ